MPESAANPVYANVAFLRIPRFDALPVAEQASLKEKLEARARAALAGLAPAERVVLDSDDGLAVILFGDPALALDTAQALHARGEPALQVGLNYGPLALTSRGAEACVYGDGLTAAAAAARFAGPDRLLVTQDFAKALAGVDPARAEGLSAAGDFTDTRVRLHSLYAPDPRAGPARARRAVVQTLAGVAVILALGAAGRYAHQVYFAPEPALVSFAIKPRGEIYVDGVARGRTPPLMRLELPAGRHVVSVRHPGFAPLELTVNLKAGEQMTVRHTFAAPRQEPKGSFWRELRRKFWGS